MPWFSDLPLRGQLGRGWTTQDVGANGPWKVCDYVEWDDQIS